MEQPVLEMQTYVSGPFPRRVLIVLSLTYKFRSIPVYLDVTSEK
jgi:hypothetical protein